MVRYWRGRLLVARGTTLYFSQPLRYGLGDPRTDFVQEAHKITLLEPVENGVFVGTKAGVFFYAGTSPKDWARTKTGALAPIAGTGTKVPSSVFGGRLAEMLQGDVALWLSTNGYVIGTNDGQIVQPQSSRIRLNANAGSTVLHDRQLITITT